MITGFFSGAAGGPLSGGRLLSFPVVLASGFFSSAINPCAIPLYPAAAHACCGVATALEKRKTSFLNATVFVLGVALSITALGIAASAAGRIVGIGMVGRYVVALIPVLMGMYKLGWLQIPLPGAGLRFLRAWPAGGLSSGWGGAFGTGFLLSLVIGPCGTPVLASILAYAAYRQSFLYGGMLLFAYGLGSGLPFIIFGTMAGKLALWIDRRGLGKWTDAAMGGLLLVLGFYLLWQA